jgi:type IV pilus assembly protein PilO
VKLRKPVIQKWLLLGGLVIALVYGYSNYVYRPRQEAIRESSEKLKQEWERLERGKRVAKSYRTLQANYAQLTVNWEAALELLPTEKEMDDLLKRITLAGRSSEVTFLLFRPLDAVEHPYYWENPIRVKTLSTYHRLGQFLSRVAALPRIVNISGLRMTAWAPRKGRSVNTVEAEFLATIYIFKPLGTTPAVSPPESPQTRKPSRRQS